MVDPEDLEILERYLPSRKKSGGREPGMTNENVKGPRRVRDWGEKDDLWTHQTPPTDMPTVRLIMGIVAQIGIRTVFENFTYTFGGHIYKQMAGGPIGGRLTMCCALLVMEWVWQEFFKIMGESQWELGPGDLRILAQTNE